MVTRGHGNEMFMDAVGVFLCCIKVMHIFSYCNEGFKCIVIQMGKMVLAPKSQLNLIPKPEGILTRILHRIRKIERESGSPSNSMRQSSIKHVNLCPGRFHEWPSKEDGNMKGHVAIHSISST